MTAPDFYDENTSSTARSALLLVHAAGVSHQDIQTSHFKKDASGRVWLLESSHSCTKALDYDKADDLASFKELVGMIQRPS